ncbi:MAG: hypothetical protein ACK5EF_00985 [Bacteroidota bacterium]|jgi:hypothetical protein
MKAPSVRNLLLGLAALLMLGHSLVPHDHSGSNPPKFILWQLFSVDLGGDHLQHFAPASCDVAPEDVQKIQLPDRSPSLRLGFALESNSPARCGASASPSRVPQGHLSSWSRRPPPSSLA